MKPGEVAKRLNMHPAHTSRAESSLVKKIASALHDPISIEYLSLLQNASSKDLYTAIDNQIEKTKAFETGPREEFLARLLNFLSWLPNDKRVLPLMQRINALHSHSDENNNFYFEFSLLRRRLWIATQWSKRRRKQLSLEFGSEIKELAAKAPKTDMRSKIDLMRLELSFHLSFTHDFRATREIAEKFREEILRKNTKGSSLSDFVWYSFCLFVLGDYEEVVNVSREFGTSVFFPRFEAHSSVLYYFVSLVIAGRIDQARNELTKASSELFSFRHLAFHHRAAFELPDVVISIFDRRYDHARTIVQGLIRDNTEEKFQFGVELGLRILETTVDALTERTANALCSIERTRKWLRRHRFGGVTEEYTYLRLLDLALNCTAGDIRYEKRINREREKLNHGLGGLYALFLDLVRTKPKDTLPANGITGIFEAIKIKSPPSTQYA
jgi:hypothetical protein